MPCKIVTIPIKVASEARGLYVSGESLSGICRRFPKFSRDQFRHLQDKESWGEARRKFQEELEDEVDDDLAIAKASLREAVVSLIRNACQKIKEGEVAVSTVKDIERIATLAGLIDLKKAVPKFDPSLRVLEDGQFEKVLRYICEREGIVTEE